MKYDDMTKAELVRECVKRGIAPGSRASKPGLIKKLRVFDDMQSVLFSVFPRHFDLFSH